MKQHATLLNSLKSYAQAFFIFALILLAYPIDATQNSLPTLDQQNTVTPTDKAYKSAFQRLKDRLISSSLSINVLGHLMNITTSTSCDPKGINKLFKKALSSAQEVNQASCTCCLAKELGRGEGYQNSVTKCQFVSKYCPAKLPFKDETQFYEKTQILSLNQKPGQTKQLKISEPSIVEQGMGVQDVEYMKYIWNLPHFYLFEQFTPATYDLKFLVGKGYLAPHPNNMRTSTNPYNHHFNKEKGIFFNPWPNAAPPIAAINAASGILGSLDIKKPTRPWIPQTSYKIKPSASITQGIRATMIGHATILLQFDGINILTDPLFFDIGLGKKEDKTVTVYKRIKTPGVPLEWLPKIHFVIISHNHMDHFDTRSLKRIEEMNPEVKYITPLGYTKLSTTPS